MGKLTINLCEELHQKIREDVAADESLTTSLLMERIIREHYEGPKPQPRIAVSYTHLTLPTNREV